MEHVATAPWADGDYITVNVNYSTHGAYVEYDIPYPISACTTAQVLKILK